MKNISSLSCKISWHVKQVPFLDEDAMQASFYGENYSEIHQWDSVNINTNIWIPHEPKAVVYKFSINIWYTQKRFWVIKHSTVREISSAWPLKLRKQRLGIPRGRSQSSLYWTTGDFGWNNVYLILRKLAQCHSVNRRIIENIWTILSKDITSNPFCVFLTT